MALAALQSNATSGVPVVIHLAPGVYLLHSAPFVFDAQTQASEVRLIGTAGTTLQAASPNVSLFKVGTGAPTVTLHGLQLRSQVYVDGGALNVQNCTFRESSAKFGGALQVRGGSLAVNHTVFEGCKATRGGAAWVSGGAAVFSNCTFKGCIASEERGAGAVWVDLSGRVVLRERTLLHGSYAAGLLDSIHIARGGELRYVLPAPLAHYIDLARDGLLTADYSGRSRAIALKTGRQYQDYPSACAAGVYGNSSVALEQRSGLCSGLCPAGYVCGAPATITPTTCKQGHYCEAGSVRGVACPSGTWSNLTGLSNAVRCKDVPAGSYAPTGSIEPTRCSPGTVQPVAGKSTCDRCAAGKYQSGEGEQACVACEAGSYCPVGASAVLPCAAGTHSSKTDLGFPGDCTPTEPGSHAPTGSTSPTPCSAGTVQPLAAQPTCDRCGAGKFMNESGRTVCHVCVPGSYCAEGASTPRPCNEGLYSNRTDLGSAADCTGTDAGHFSPTGSTEQTECSPGTVQPDAGKGTCDKCAAGTYQQGEGRQACVDCEPGSYCPVGASAALPCKGGSHSDATNLTTDAKCTPTAKGHYAPTGSTMQTACSPGTVAPNVSMATCVKCEAGKYQADEGKQVCVACDPGSFCPKGASAALPCKKGSYSSATNLASASECTETGVGHFAPTGSTQQTPCSPGTVASAEGMGTCLPCAAGSFMNVSGQSACLECPAGFVCAAQATAAVPCKGGTFGGSSGLRGVSDCEDAEPGFYAQAGSVAPTPCPPWGFCPGRRADQVNDVPGSIPIVIPEGRQTRTVTEMVEQAINQTLLELPLQVKVADVQAFNDTAVRLRVANMLGLPLHVVSLSFGAPRRRLSLLTARSRRLVELDFVVLDFVVTITDEPAVNITSANIIWTNQSKSLSTLSAKLGIDVLDAPSPVVATQVTVQSATVSALVVVECPAGSWGANGECVPCSKGTYRPGDANGAGCLECPAGTYQPFLGGSECTVCGAGNYSANTLSCEPCQVGEYCPEDSAIGTPCPLGSTTDGNGAVNYDDCGCPAGMFDTAAVGHRVQSPRSLLVIKQSDGKPLEFVLLRSEITCIPCSDDMLCSRTGLTLATVPLPPSRWRLSVTDRHIRTWDPLIGADPACLPRALSELHRRHQDMRHFRQHIPLPRRRGWHQVRRRPHGTAL